jgi:Eco57I restriction-modification methylase/MmeI, target recognition domain
VSPPRGRGRAWHASGFDHAEWLSLVDVSGPFLSIPVLRRIWPAGLDALEGRARSMLREEHGDYFDLPTADRDHRHWIRYVLADLLGWAELLRWRQEIDTKRLTLEVPEHGETVTPSFGLQGRDGVFRLLGVICDGPPTGRVTHSSWPASPADRLAQLLRQHDVPLGLVTNGGSWTFVWAPRRKATCQATFYATMWREEPNVLRAFVSLLCRARFFGVSDNDTLPALLQQSEGNQEEITEALGNQVRRAVELLIGAIGRAEQEFRRHNPEAPALPAREAYFGAITVMMRLVFLLFAEECHLLPNDDPIFQAHYSASRLVDELERRASEPGGEAALEYTHVAWHRLLALFRAMHGGVNAGSLRLPPYDGNLFDPDIYRWLEGRFGQRDDIRTEVLRIDDRTALHMLRAIQYVEVGTGKGKERRRLSFAALEPEQVGFVYEGLLGFHALRADDDVLGLIGRPGDEEEVSLTEIEEHAAAAAADGGDLLVLAERLSARYKNSGIGSAQAIARKLSPLLDKELPEARRKLLSAVGNDAHLAEKLIPFYRLLRPDLSGLPTVFRKGTLFVTESPLRRFSGTHYTPKFLAKEVVEGALEPLVYSPGPLQTADTRLWKLKGSAEILRLKIADIAMGSGAFLVAAARYLGDRLIEAWAVEGDERAEQHLANARRSETGGASGPVVIDTDPVVIKARRLVIQRCLYGVDINPMAVEMAKLSLWRVSMLAAPFTFIEDKLACGDSLLGITNLEQLEWMHLDPRRGRALHEDRPWAFNRSAREIAAEIRGLREQISWLGDSPEDHAIKQKLLADARDKGSPASRIANLVTGAALVEAGPGPRKYDPNMVAANLARLAAEGQDEGWDRVRNQALEWLDTDRVPYAFTRTPLHWPLVFPEVFLEKEGFDAIVGNPPYLGGTRITGPLGTVYREHLVQSIAQGVRGGGRCDLVTYFVLRAHTLLNATGQTGLIATNTLAQGDTREVGLDQLIVKGVTIRRAIKSAPWPSRSAALEYCCVWTTCIALSNQAQRTVDTVPAPGITSSLDPQSRVIGSPKHLAANRGVSFEGSKVTGMGFLLTAHQAHELLRNDKRNAKAIFPYLVGEDVNSRPDCSASRWIINFHDWTEDQAKAYESVFSIVEKKVRPERQRRKADGTYVLRRPLPERYWQYADKRPAMIRALASFSRVIVLTKVSKFVMPVMVPTGQVIAHKLAVFATDNTALLALLSSTQHYWWAITHSSTLETRINYSPSDVFETFPLAGLTAEIGEVGDRLHIFRREVMLARQTGLTKTYNLVHDRRCVDADIAELREIHRHIDQAVNQAYGWDDLDLDHGFHETRQGIRYTIGLAIRQEILDRLLELNHERYAAEVAAGLHDKKGRRRDAGEQGELFT